MIVRVYVPFGIIRALVSDDPPRAASDSSSREMRTSRRRVSHAGVSFAEGTPFYGFAGWGGGVGGVRGGGATEGRGGEGRRRRRRRERGKGGDSLHVMHLNMYPR